MINESIYAVQPNLGRQNKLVYLCYWLASKRPSVQSGKNANQANEKNVGPQPTNIFWGDNVILTW